jgi:nicotinamidase-related amidase
LVFAKHRAETLIISGGETDVCVLSTVLSAVDLGYRIILVEGALCSSSQGPRNHASEPGVVFGVCSLNNAGTALCGVA